MEQDNKIIYTIGYATHTIDSFIAALEKFKITAVADVRSQPYSTFKPEFNRESLKDILTKNRIEYVFLGDNIGARIKAPECYKKGKVVFGLTAKHPLFQEGIDRLLRGIKIFSIAIMCAEKDPVSCHRMILISKHLKNYQVKIRHIIDAETLEDNRDTESRLMKLFRLDQPDLFMKEKERLEQAYALQEEKIAYEEHP